MSAEYRVVGKRRVLRTAEQEAYNGACCGLRNKKHMCLSVCVCVCVRACVRMRVRVCVCVCALILADCGTRRPNNYTKFSILSWSLYVRERNNRSLYVRE